MSLKPALISAGFEKYISFSLALFLLLVFTSQKAGSAGQEAGNVKDIKGTANILREKKTLNAGKNDPVFGTDTVKTFEDSRAKILFIDDSLLMIGENSIVSLLEHFRETGKKQCSSVFNLA